MRKVNLAVGEHYHIFNRGTEKRKIFQDDSDYFRFLLSMLLMNDGKDGLMIQWRDYREVNPKADVETFLRSNLRERKPLVKIVCFALLPNHFHFVLEQLADRGIEKFMQRIGTGYTMYFNKKYERNGVLFQGKFKSSHLDSNERLLFISAYVNCNPEVHCISPAGEYRWSSFLGFLAKKENDISKGKVVYSQFAGNEYNKYCKESLIAMKNKKEDEKIILE